MCFYNFLIKERRGNTIRKQILDYKKLEDLLIAKQMSPAMLSQSVGVGADVLSRWKSGESEPKLDKLSKIASFFGVNAEYFMRDD